MAIQNNFPNIRPSLNLNFALSKRVDPRITFVRASTATYFDQDGVLQTAQNNQGRITFDPTTLDCQGLLIEEQRTNSIRNNTMQGAVAGTPGTLPTNWVLQGTATSSVVGTGTENGITYIDVRFQGASAADSFNLLFDALTQVTAANGQAWTGSFYLKLVSGSLTNLSLIQRLAFRNSGGSNIQSVDSSVLTPTSASISSQRTSISLTASQATTAAVTTALNSGTPAGAYDITLRIGLPQLELGAFATSVIPTTTTALTRNADVASMTGANFSAIYNQAEGTVYVEYQPNATAYTGGTIAISDGTLNNRMIVRGITTTNIASSIGVSGGVTQWNDGFSSQTATNTKFVLAYKVNDIAFTRNGVTPLTDTVATIPTVNQLRIGVDGDGTNILNGTIRAIRYYPVRLSNAQLQALTG